MNFSANIYLAWASDNQGSDFSLSFDPELPYLGVCVSSAAIENLSAEDYTWQYAPVDSAPISPTAANCIRGETPAGSGCAFQLAHVPVGDIDLFLNGQRLTRVVDYSLAESGILLARSVTRDDILRAGYNY